ncbi:MAG: hypothetical protein Q9171_004026 [Xanthocarpia ochracea]
MTPLCTVRGFGAPSMRINNAGDGHEEVLANISSNFDNPKCDPDIDIRVAADQLPPSGFTVNLKRDKGTFTRSHKMTLSDGKTYRLTGKHSDCLLMCWGNLKVVEECNKTKVAEFKVEWLMSVHKIGVVTFIREVEETLLREILFAVVGVASREYAVAMAGLAMTDRQDVGPFDGFTTLSDTVHLVSLCSLELGSYISA